MLQSGNFKITKFVVEKGNDPEHKGIEVLPFAKGSDARSYQKSNQKPSDFFVVCCIPDSKFFPHIIPYLYVNLHQLVRQ